MANDDPTSGGEKTDQDAENDDPYARVTCKWSILFPRRVLK